MPQEWQPITWDFRGPQPCHAACLRSMGEGQHVNLVSFLYEVPPEHSSATPPPPKGEGEKFPASGSESATGWGEGWLLTPPPHPHAHPHCPLLNLLGLSPLPH